MQTVVLFLVNKGMKNRVDLKFNMPLLSPLERKETCNQTKKINQNSTKKDVLDLIGYKPKQKRKYKSK